ncbi:MAG: class I SAM-dependent methyltransferase [Desulfurococcus sp.]|nr:class I SAM-dependent methyltransferase [Desulfurococcus sp.]
MPRIAPFEEYPTRYDEWFEKHKYAYLSELNAIKLLLPRFKRGLEIGVGTGRFAIPLGIKFGVEPSKRMREIAAQRGVNVVDGVGENLPFKDGSFDLVLMVTTICYLDDPLKALKESYRVLKSKGAVIIGFIDRESLLGRIYMEEKDTNPFYRDASFYTVREVVEMLYEAGFRSLDFTQTIFRRLDEISGEEPVKYGFGEGSFIAVRAFKLGSMY